MTTTLPQHRSNFICKLFSTVVMVLLATVAAHAQWTTPDGNQNISNTNTGNVGIGTPTPTALLEVKKNQNAGTAIIIDNPFTTAANTAITLLSFRQNGANRFHIASINDNNNIHIGGPGTVQLWNFANAPTIFANNNTETMRISATGNLGIGVNAPSDKLHVRGTVRVENPDGTGPVVFARTTGASGYPTTTSAGYPLIMSNRLYLRDLTSGAASSINALGTVDLNASAVAGVGPVALRVTGAADNNNPTLQTRNAAGTPTVTVLGTGNVGIGTTTPAKSLDVVGDINASGTITAGNIQAKYQDVAEWVESSQELAPGTVVVLDRKRSNQVSASSESYDSRVAGVISLRPGLELGEKAEGRVLVATTGRVKVKVDAGDGPIEIGDLLVTSEREGYAMRSVPVDVGGVRLHRPGTLIGKALEPLAKGTGEILVLLSLQ